MRLVDQKYYLKSNQFRWLYSMNKSILLLLKTTAPHLSINNQFVLKE